MRCQHNHHRPRVSRDWTQTWRSDCACGWRAFRINWHMAFVAAMAHSQEIQ